MAECWSPATGVLRVLCSAWVFRVPFQRIDDTRMVFRVLVCQRAANTLYGVPRVQMWRRDGDTLQGVPRVWGWRRAGDTRMVFRVY